MAALRLLLKLTVVSWSLNLLWENLQWPLYSSDLHSWDQFMMCLRASLMDAGLIVGGYGIIALLRREWLWLRQRHWLNYGMFVMLALTVTTWIEWRALAEGRWNYGELMPIVPGLEVGLSPFVQLALLGILSLELTRKLGFTRSDASAN